jgi:hypothetical protein
MKKKKTFKFTLPGVKETEARIREEKKRIYGVPLYGSKHYAHEFKGVHNRPHYDVNSEWLIEFEDTPEARNALLQNQSTKEPTKLFIDHDD